MANLIDDILISMFSFWVLFFSFMFLVIFSEKKDKLHSIPSLSKLPSLSIIIPAYNEEKSIETTIKNVKSLLYPKRLLEIVAVDDGSTDKTLDILKKIKGLKVISKRHGGKATALNVALGKAKGELFAVIDSDSFPKRDALLKSIPYFSDESVKAVTTSIFIYKPRNLLERMQQIEYAIIAWGRKLLEFLDSVSVTPGPLSIYRTDTLREIGGFDTKIVTEDIEIACRLLSKNHKVKMAYDARTFTRAPSTFKEWWHQRIRWNVGGMQIISKYGKSIFRSGSFGMFVLPCMILSFALTFGMLGYGLYRIGKWIMISGTVLSNLIFFGFNPLYNVQYLFIPDVLTILLLAILVTSLITTRRALRSTRITISKKTANYIFNLAIYFFVYPGAFVFNMVASLWKFLRKDYMW